MTKWALLCYARLSIAKYVDNILSSRMSQEDPDARSSAVVPWLSSTQGKPCQRHLAEVKWIWLFIGESIGTEAS